MIFTIIYHILAYGFVWKCWVNIPNEIAIKKRDNDQQNHWVLGVHYFQTHPYIRYNYCNYSDIDDDIIME